MSIVNIWFDLYHPFQLRVQRTDDRKTVYTPPGTEEQFTSADLNEQGLSVYSKFPNEKRELVAINPRERWIDLPTVGGGQFVVENLLIGRRYGTLDDLLKKVGAHTVPGFSHQILHFTKPELDKFQEKLYSDLQARLGACKLEFSPDQILFQIYFVDENHTGD